MALSTDVPGALFALAKKGTRRFSFCQWQLWKRKKQGFASLLPNTSQGCAYVLENSSGTKKPEGVHVARPNIALKLVSCVCQTIFIKKVPGGRVIISKENPQGCVCIYQCFSLKDVPESRMPLSKEGPRLPLRSCQWLCFNNATSVRAATY